MPGRAVDSYSLFLAEDRLVSQLAQSPSTARRLVNFIPSRAGDLKRKSYAPPFTLADVPLIGGFPAWASFVGDYLFYDANGDQDRQVIVGVSNNSATFLYKYVSGGTLTPLPNGAFDPPHNTGNGWVKDPLLLYSDGLLFISDGFSNTNPNPNLNGNWTVYDGINTWKMGLDIPAAATINVGGTSTPGSIQIDLWVEYVITEYDSIRKHESPPGARVRFTPATPATYDVQIDLPAAVNKAPATASDWTAGYADKWRIYRSHIDGSGRLFRVAELAIAATTFVDTVPAWGEAAVTAMVPLEPPYESQKPKPSLVGAKLHNRFAMRDEDRKSRIWVTGFAEVREQDPKSQHAIETVPGARNLDITDINNLSIFENFIEIPDESYEVRAMLWREEGLLMGTERSVMFLWGSKPEEFRPGNTVTYNFGVFHKNSFLNTTHGLIIFTDDRKIVLDPAKSQVPGERTDQVIDLGWPQQPELDKTDIVFTNRFQMRHWKQGSERDWLVVAYTTQNVVDGGTAHLIIYDFEIGGWLSFDDVEATCIGIVEEDEGFQFLVAGNNTADRKIKVVTDFDSSGSSPYQAADARLGLPAAGTELLPANTWRTAIMDLNTPNVWKVWRHLSYYKKGGFTVVVKAWLDPADVDSLGAGTTLTFNQLSSNEFHAELLSLPGHAKRAVFEFTIAADANSGSLQGVEINVSDRANVGV